jgi:hypothetical protein
MAEANIEVPEQALRGPVRSADIASPLSCRRETVREGGVSTVVEFDRLATPIRDTEGE